MNIYDYAVKDLFVKRTLSVKPETDLLKVMACLVSAGVWIEGRYTMEIKSNRTIIEFLATDLQWEVIKMLVGNMNKYLGHLDKAFEELIKD